MGLFLLGVTLAAMAVACGQGVPVASDTPAPQAVASPGMDPVFRPEALSSGTSGSMRTEGGAAMGGVSNVSIAKTRRQSPVEAESFEPMPIPTPHSENRTSGAEPGGVSPETRVTQRERCSQ
jgi:hypothetical protein